MANSSSTVNHSASIAPVAERMGFSVVNAVVIALLLWVGSTLNKSQIEVAALKVEIAHLRVEMNRSLEADSDQRQRLVKAERDISELKARVYARND